MVPTTLDRDPAMSKPEIQSHTAQSQRALAAHHDELSGTNRLLLQQNRELEDRVAALTTELHQAQTELKRVSSDLTQLSLEFEDRLALRVGEFEYEVAERERAEERLQQQVARLKLIHQITESIGERHDLQSIYRVVLAQLEENLPIDVNAICSIDMAGGTLSVVAVGPKCRALHAQLGLDEEAVFSWDADVLSQCVLGDLIYEPDISLGKAPILRKLAEAGLRSLVVAPVAGGRQVVWRLADRPAHRPGL